MPPKSSSSRRIFLDRNIPAEIKDAFPDAASVQTMAEAGWEDLADEKLYQSIGENFDVFFTSNADRRYHRALSVSPFTTVVVPVPDNRVESFRPLYEKMRETASYTNPGRIYVIL